eukprot:scaffold8917_cov174-Skeletonema_menzelii.AAC.1
MDVIQQRIYSPFILMVCFQLFQVGAALEMGAHHYIADWGLKVSLSDLINGSASFCIYGGQHIQAIALRKRGVPFLRCPDFSKGILHGLIDMIAIVGDLFLLVVTIFQPVLYSKLGRAGSVIVFIPSSGVAGIISTFRLWQNLGPNKYTFWGASLFLAFALCGVVANFLYEATCIEVIHAAIASSFACSVISFSVALWHAELPGPDVSSDEVIKGVARQIKLWNGYLLSVKVKDD